MNGNDVVEHIERCAICMSRQLVIDILEEGRKVECLNDKGISIYDIGKHIREDKCKFCDIINDMVSDLKERQITCCCEGN